MPVELEWSVPEEAAASVPAPTFAAAMADRLLMFIRNTTGRAIVQTFASRIEALRDLVPTILAAFDLATTTGVHLDRLGAILQRPRFGETDARYRVLLQIQVQIILSSQATTAALLEIVRLYTGAHAPSYAEAHPMFVGLGAIVETADVPQLLDLLTKAKGGGTALHLYTQDADGLMLDSVTTPLDDASTLDSVTTPVAGAGTLAGVYTI